MQVALPLLQSDDLPVEVEYEEDVIAQYPIGGMEVMLAGLLFYLRIPVSYRRGVTPTRGRRERPS